MSLDSKLHVQLPSEKHTHTIILLHGKGSTAPEFASDFLESQDSDDLILPEIFPTFKWVFPTSDLRTSAQFKEEMSQWFDIWSTEETEERKEMQKEGLKESIAFILEVVKKEMEFVPAGRIVLGGISQGCATAIHAYWGEEDMDGIAKCIEEQKETATSPLLEEIWNPPPLSTENPEWRTERNLIAQLKQAHRTPVFLSHSKDDNVVPIGNGVRLSQCLADICESIEWRTYEDGGHWVKEPQGVDDMVNFIKSKVLS